MAEGYADLQEALAELKRSLEEAGVSRSDQAGDPSIIHNNPAAKKAIKLYRREVAQFFRGHVSGGYACESCGRPDSGPGQCRHCSGIVSTAG